MASENKINIYRSPEGLALLEGLSRDGFSYKDIAHRIGVSPSLLSSWRKNYPEIDSALRKGREVVDYQVENALFKSAVGYRSKEVTITTKMERGRVVSVEKTAKFRDQAPNVNAINTWLYNRLPDKWKKNGNVGLSDIINDEESNIQITVARGKKEESKEDSDWGVETNDEVNISKKKEPSDSEIKIENTHKDKRESNFSKWNKKKIEEDKLKKSSYADLDSEETWQNSIDNLEQSQHIGEDPEEDLDEWPDNWEDLIGYEENEVR